MKREVAVLTPTVTDDALSAIRLKKNMSVRDKGVTAEIYQPEKDYRY